MRLSPETAARNRGSCRQKSQITATGHGGQPLTPAVIVLPGFTSDIRNVVGEDQSERANPTEQAMNVTFHAHTAFGIADIAAIRPEPSREG
jgi:hypothetical protein